MKPRIIITAAALLAAACNGDDHAPGSLELAVHGEEHIEGGIPAAEVSDDWDISFDSFLVSLGDITASVGHGDPAVDDDTYRIFDLTPPSGGEGHMVLVAEDVPGGHYDHVGYGIAPDPGAVAGNASADDVALMLAEGYAVRVAGTASKDGVTKSFDWGFTGGTLYDHCDGGTVVDGDTQRMRFTIHGDHLFYDDLTGAAPDMAFQLIADADTNDDDVITAEELAAVDIRDEDRYQSEAAADDLWSYLEAAVGGLGHIEGDHHCNAVPL